jgi:hypothetical protein
VRFGKGLLILEEHLFRKGYHMTNFVTISINEFEYDALIELLGAQEVQSGFGQLYDRLIDAALHADADEEEIEEELEDEDESEEEDE